MSCQSVQKGDRNGLQGGYETQGGNDSDGGQRDGRQAQELAPQIDDILEFAGRVIEHGDYVLSQTPEMLPVLKQAGVVDSGGQG